MTKSKAQLNFEELIKQAKEQLMSKEYYDISPTFYLTERQMWDIFWMFMTFKDTLERIRNIADRIQYQDNTVLACEQHAEEIIKEINDTQGLCEKIGL